MAKLHPADRAEIEKIAAATHFTVHLRAGPHDKITKNAKTLTAAIRIADAMGATPGGRRPMIYAITPDHRAALVPAAMVAKRAGRPARSRWLTEPRGRYSRWFDVPICYRQAGERDEFCKAVSSKSSGH